jgi:hypothetical protein
MISSIFIHIPRTGGTVLKWCLNDKIQNLEYIQKQGHAFARLRKQNVGDWERRYKFTIIRNPWERAVSLYYKSLKSKTFAEWLQETDLDQEHYFCDLDGSILVNDIFRYEHLAESVHTICERAGWPQFTLNRIVNETEHGHYSEYFTEENKHTFDEFAEKYEYAF